MPRNLGAGPFVVDASFVIGVLLSESLATRFSHVLGTSSIVDVNLGEVFYKIAEKKPVPPERIAQVLVAQGLTVTSLGVKAAALFPTLKSTDMKNRAKQREQGSSPSDIKSLSLGDMACLASALVSGLTVLTGDKHWKTLRLPLSIEDYRDPNLLP